PLFVVVASSLPRLSLTSFPTRRSSDLQLELQAFGDFAFHRDAGNVIRRLLGPPVAGGECVAGGQVCRPGQAQVTLDRPVTCGFLDRKSTRLNSSHVKISYAVFCLKKKK